MIATIRDTLYGSLVADILTKYKAISKQNKIFR